MSPARAQNKIQTAQSRVQRTNHEATIFPIVIHFFPCNFLPTLLPDLQKKFNWQSFKNCKPVFTLLCLQQGLFVQHTAHNLKVLIHHSLTVCTWSPSVEQIWKITVLITSLETMWEICTRKPERNYSAIQLWVPFISPCFHVLIQSFRKICQQLTVFYMW